MVSFNVSRSMYTSLHHLFGFSRLYQFTHIFPYHCTVVAQDRFRPPPFSGDYPDPHHLVLEGSTRRMEGLRQKGWTAHTIAMISLVAHELRTTASVLGQGDNQVLVVELPDRSDTRFCDTTPSQFMDLFISRLYEVSTELGMRLKTEETWCSSVLFEYSKQYHVGGAAVSCALKRASRVSSDANDGIKTRSNRVSSVFSAGIGVAGTDSSPGPGYALTLIAVATNLTDML